MSFVDRMRADTGAPYPVWLYLLDKLAHTALAAWVLVTVFDESLLYASVLAAMSYLVLGKLLWLRSTTDPVWLMAEVQDCAFDGVLGLGVAVLALLPTYGWHAFVWAIIPWIVLLDVGSANSWGRPS